MTYTQEEMREYMRGYRQRRRLEAIERLGGACVRCGSTESLQFDHVDPSEKEVSVGTWSISRERLDRELKKCQLLCYDCHLVKTSVDLRTPRGGPEHGITGYIARRCRCLICRTEYSIWRKRRWAEKHT